MIRVQMAAAAALIGVLVPTLAAAQDAPPVAEAPDFTSVDVTVGAEQQGWDSDRTTQATPPSFVLAPDVDSAKFLEYRDLPQGAVLPEFRYRGKRGTWRWDLSGRDVTQRDQSYFARVERGDVRLAADYAGIPHNFGFGGRSILSPTTPERWQISDTVQAAWQSALTATLPGRNIDYSCEPRAGFTPRPGCLSLSNLVSPTLSAQPPNVNLTLQRGRSRVALDLTPGGGPLEVGVSYQHEKRAGYRAVNGTSFGFGNVVETPEPLRYVTQDVGVDASYTRGWGSVRAAVRLNDFRNSLDFFSFENPFRATDSTDPSAYVGPGTSSINGAVVGQTALPPDNRALSEMIGARVKLGPNTRLSADITLGQWKQDEDALAPWTTNTAIVMPDGRPAATAPVFARTLGGRIDTTSLSASLHTTVASRLGLTARYRRYDMENKTPRYELPQGYVRFDAVWEEIPRISVPYGYTNDVLDAYGTYAVGPVGLEAGYRLNRLERTFRETGETNEGVFRAAADYRGGWLSARALAEIGARDYDDYSLEHSEDASFLEPGPPANQTVLRRADQARRDLSRFGGQVEFSPGDRFGLFASYTRTQFDYADDPVECQAVERFPGESRYCPGGEQLPLGLMNDRYDSLSVEATFRPAPRLGFFAFYTYEDGDILQTGRQSGGTVNFNPADVWTSNSTTTGHSFGGGADLTLLPETWTANVTARYQRVDGFNSIGLRPGFSNAVYGTNPVLLECTAPGASPCDVPAFDDTRLASAYGSLRYQFATQWNASVTLGYENYEIDDNQTNTQLNYLPGSFFLQANNRSYDGWIGYVNLSYAIR